MVCAFKEQQRIENSFSSVTVVEFLMLMIRSPAVWNQKIKYKQVKLIPLNCLDRTTLVCSRVKSGFSSEKVHRNPENCCQTSCEALFAVSIHAILTKLFFYFGRGNGSCRCYQGCPIVWRLLNNSSVVLSFPNIEITVWDTFTSQEMLFLSTQMQDWKGYTSRVHWKCTKRILWLKMIFMWQDNWHAWQLLLARPAECLRPTRSP